MFSHYSYQTVTSSSFRERCSVCGGAAFWISAASVRLFVITSPLPHFHFRHADLWMILDTSGQKHWVILVDEIHFWGHRTATFGSKSRSHDAIPEMPVCLFCLLLVIPWVGITNSNETDVVSYMVMHMLETIKGILNAFLKNFLRGKKLNLSYLFFWQWTNIGFNSITLQQNPSCSRTSRNAFHPRWRGWHGHFGRADTDSGCCCVSLPEGLFQPAE